MRGGSRTGTERLDVKQPTVPLRPGGTMNSTNQDRFVKSVRLPNPRFVHSLLLEAFDYLGLPDPRCGGYHLEVVRGEPAGAQKAIVTRPLRSRSKSFCGALASTCSWPGRSCASVSQKVVWKLGLRWSLLKLILKTQDVFPFQSRNSI